MKSNISRQPSVRLSVCPSIHSHSMSRLGGFYVIFFSHNRLFCYFFILFDAKMKSAPWVEFFLGLVFFPIHSSYNSGQTLGNIKLGWIWRILWKFSKGYSEVHIINYIEIAIDFNKPLSIRGLLQIYYIEWTFALPQYIQK